MYNSPGSARPAWPPANYRGYHRRLSPPLSCRGEQHPAREVIDVTQRRRKVLDAQDPRRDDVDRSPPQGRASCDAKPRPEPDSETAGIQPVRAA